MTIAAIPTMYAGIQFRSRLEAKWAAFFNQCGWRYEYEPTDFSGYIPDFKIGKGLFEVKPATIFPADAAAKMFRAIDLFQMRDEITGLHILQEAPSVRPFIPFARVLGWSLDGESEEDASLLLVAKVDTYGKSYPRLLEFIPAIKQFAPWGWDAVSGATSRPFDGVTFDDGSVLDHAWRKACNSAQWKAPHGQG